MIKTVSVILKLIFGYYLFFCYLLFDALFRECLTLWTDTNYYAYAIKIIGIFKNFTKPY